MQIGTVRTPEGTRAARVERDHIVLLDAPDLGAVLRADQLGAATTAGGDESDLDTAVWAPPVIDPDKIVCVGLNYRAHILEMDREVPTHPTYFAKFRGAMIGATDMIALPPPSVSTNIDWEVELCIVIGTRARNVSASDALDHIAGFTILNDVSIRDWQNRTRQYLAGKTFEGMTPVGPFMTTADELGDGRGLGVRTTVDGVTKQDSNTDDLIFGPAELIEDLSTIITLEPGDLIATGTPSGVGAGRSPKEWLSDGVELVTTIDGIGELRNRCRLPA